MRFCALALVGLMAGCTEFPELDAVQTPGIQDSPYPALVPLETIVNDPEPIATPEMIGQVRGRAAGLDRRAGDVRGGQPASATAVDARLARLRARAEALRAQ